MLGNLGAIVTRPIVLSLPPFWAALAALALNLGEVPAPSWIAGLLSLMGAAVVPLMLVSVGMALRHGFASGSTCRW